jgi:thymidine phosphorylase
MEVMGGNRLAAPRLHDLTVALGGRLLALAGEPEGEAEEKIASALSSGRAMENFAKMVAELGGPPDMADDWRTHLPAAPVVGDVVALTDGYISAMNGEALGFAVVNLGGGRRVEADKIDPAVGITDVLRLGTRVSRGDPIAVIHARTEDSAEAAAKAIRAAITIGPEPDIGPILRERID